MAIFLVRHAHAGDRSRWSDDDRLRPLTERGQAQAASIARHLADEPIATLLSSPYLRCLQTFGPLSNKLDVAIDSDWRLLEGTDAMTAFEVIDGRDELALCSHGDVIPDLLDLLGSKGVPVHGRGCEKGSIWRLDVAGGVITKASKEPSAIS